MQTYSNKTIKISKKPLLISVKNLTVKYDNYIALKDISFNVYKGDYIYVIGQNGAGKSTLIKAITRLLKPSEGNVILNTHNIGFLPQVLNRKNNFPITVEEVIYSGFKKQKLFISKEDKQLINTWLDKMKLSNLNTKMMSELSGGQQQRVYLIRALISNPDLLILDEPTSSLDPEFRKHFYDLLEELNKNNTTIIFITHDIELTSCNDKLILQIDQELIYFGKVEDNKEVCHHHV